MIAGPLQPLRGIALNTTNRCCCVRFQSTKSLNDIPIRLAAIPLTTKKSFIYCKHNHLSKPPSEATIFEKAFDKAAQTWDKMTKSESTVNVKIVAGVNKLLDQIPWDEHSLRSIPSAGSIVRELKEDKMIADEALLINRDDRKLVQQKDIIEDNIQVSNDSLISIPVYYPSSITSQQAIVKQMALSSTIGQSSHYRKLFWCLVGLPFTIPFIALPVVPNIPGFYLCYRAYCHYAAIRGAKHLQLLLNKGHLEYHKVDHGTLHMYEASSDKEIIQNLKEYLSNGNNDEGPEKLLLGNDVVERVCRSFECEELIAEVKLALKQERYKILQNKD